MHHLLSTARDFYAGGTASAEQCKMAPSQRKLLSTKLRPNPDQSDPLACVVHLDKIKKGLTCCVMYNMFMTITDLF
jgi:hypothetical protein